MVGRPSIAPAIENQRAPLLHLYSPAKEKLWLEVFLPNRGVKVARVASGHGATRWAREISRHVVVLHGHAARTGGDVELFYRRSRYAPARLPIVAETLPVRGSVSARVFSPIASPSRGSRGAHPPADRPAISARTRRVLVLLSTDPIPLFSTSTGIALPVVVPPIRESFGSTKTVPPPNPHAVAKALRGGN